MIESKFDNELNSLKYSITTELKLKSFLTQVSKLYKNETSSTIGEDLNEANDVLYIPNFSSIEKLNPSMLLKEGEIIEKENLEHYFISNKDINSSSDLIGKKRKIFKVNYRIRFDKENSTLCDEKIITKNMTLPTIKRRRENMDNIHKKIKTAFFNNFIYNKINEKLKKKKSRLYFVKFPISFVNDVKRNTNKDIINLSLLEIISKKELYNENDLSNYYHNLKVIENKETLENEELNEILNKKYCELFEEYINSKEFNIDEINRLKNKNMDNAYIKRYLYLAKNFIKYFENLDDYY